MIEYGIKIILKNDEKDTKWFSDKRQRDMALPYHKAQKFVKSAKPIERKKR